MTTAVDISPKLGEVVRVRSRRYLVEEVEPGPIPRASDAPRTIGIRRATIDTHSGSLQFVEEIGA